MTYRDSAKPPEPEPRIRGGPATVIATVIALFALCLTAMWLSATHG